MQLAARYGHLPVVRLLIDAKAKLDAVDDFKCEFSAFDNIKSNGNLCIFVFNRQTATYYAAYFGHANVVHWLAKVRFYVSV